MSAAAAKPGLVRNEPPPLRCARLTKKIGERTWRTLPFALATQGRVAGEGGRIELEPPQKKSAGRPLPGGSGAGVEPGGDEALPPTIDQAVDLSRQLGAGGDPNRQRSQCGGLGENRDPRVAPCKKSRRYAATVENRV